MNIKGKFPFMILIILFFLCAAVFCLLAFTSSPSWKEHAFAHMSPWIFLVPIFIVVMIVLCIFSCRKRSSGMCDWDGWKRWCGSQTAQKEQEQDEPARQAPGEILKIRLAKGEITEEEYDRLLQKISRQTPGKE